jgi:hypothetical protein
MHLVQKDRFRRAREPCPNGLSIDGHLIGSVTDIQGHVETVKRGLAAAALAGGDAVTKGWERRQVIKTIEIDPIATMDFHRRLAPLPHLQAFISAYGLLIKPVRMPKVVKGVSNSVP